jgi:tetratricopeptide (TPR) repeat protein
LGHRNVQAWLYVLLGIIFVILIQWLYLRFIPAIIVKVQKKTAQKRILAATGALLLLAMVLALMFSNKIMAALQGFIKIRSILDRIYFIQDALHMIKDRPFLGWGGGGWQEAYHYYQSFSYVSTQVHSYFTQIAIETEIIGLLVVAGIWAFFLISGRQAFRKSRSVNDKVLVTALTVGVLSLGFHAAIDFDLSLSAISLVLFSYMAIVRSLDKPPSLGTVKDKKTKASKPAFVLASSAVLAVIFFAGCLSAAENYKNDAVSFIKQNNYAKAVQLMERAITLNPFKAEYSHVLAELYRNTGQKDKALEEALKAADKSKYEPNRRSLLASLAMEKGDFEEASRYVEEILRLAPWEISGYESAGVVFSGIGLFELKKNNTPAANKYFKAAAELPDTVSNKINSLDPVRRNLILNFGVTAKLLLTAGISNLMLGDISKAEYQLKEAVLSQETKGNALVWLGLLSEKKGDPVSAGLYLSRAKEVSPDYEKVYREFKQLVK